MKYLLFFAAGFIIGNTKQQTRKRKTKALLKKLNSVVVNIKRGELLH